MYKHFYRWLVVVVWCGVIFYFSSIPSLRITYGIWDLILRKIAHAAEFGILTFLAYKAFNLENKPKTKKALILAFVFSFCYAISDEIHQSFVLGRQASVLDVGIDSLGIILVTFYLAKSSFKLKTAKLKGRS